MRGEKGGTAQFIVSTSPTHNRSRRLWDADEEDGLIFEMFLCLKNVSQRLKRKKEEERERSWISMSRRKKS